MEDGNANDVASFGDTLCDVLMGIIQKDCSPGLLALAFPTRSGKPYAIATCDVRKYF
jgi:hypothetical protein